MAKSPIGTPKGWSSYEVADFLSADLATMRAAVKKAAKAANQRLVRLERAGKTRGIYQTTMKQLAGRKRFKEFTKNLSINELRQEYAQLRTFISAKSSTVVGQRDTDEKRYQTAVENGFTGTFDEFYDLVEKIFAERKEAMFSSNIAYRAILEGTSNIYMEVIDRHKEQDTSEGEKLKEFLKRRREHKRQAEAYNQLSLQLT